MTQKLYTLEVIQVTDKCFVDRNHKYHVQDESFKINSSERIYSVTELLGSIDFTSTELTAAAEVGVEIHKAFELGLHDTYAEYIEYFEGDEYDLSGPEKLQWLLEKAETDPHSCWWNETDPRIKRVCRKVYSKLWAAIADACSYENCETGFSHYTKVMDLAIEKPLVVEIAVSKVGVECARIFIGGTADFASSVLSKSGFGMLLVADLKTATSTAITQKWRLQLQMYALMYGEYFGKSGIGQKRIGVILNPSLETPEYLAAYEWPTMQEYNYPYSTSIQANILGELIVNKKLNEAPKKFDADCVDYVNALQEIKSAIEEINKEYTGKINALEHAKEAELRDLEANANTLVRALKKKQDELGANEIPGGRFLVEEKTRVRTAIDLGKVNSLGIMGAGLYTTKIQKVEYVVKVIDSEGREETVIKTDAGL